MDYGLILPTLTSHIIFYMGYMVDYLHIHYPMIMMDDYWRFNTASKRIFISKTGSDVYSYIILLLNLSNVIIQI